MDKWGWLEIEGRFRVVDDLDTETCTHGIALDESCSDCTQEAIEEGLLDEEDIFDNEN